MCALLLHAIHFQPNLASISRLYSVSTCNGAFLIYSSAFALSVPFKDSRCFRITLIFGRLYSVFLLKDSDVQIAASKLLLINKGYLLIRPPSLVTEKYHLHVQDICIFCPEYPIYNIYSQPYAGNTHAVLNDNYNMP